ncbi:MAG TPA: 2-phosphosulfolactate phosphatase [Candidatus Woesebacteria bacterium]|nr:2-phosphosulfolactate phosphatase [Candidatus Woesebacteria bacterium]
MKVNLYWSWETPQKPADICVVFDVYAATSNISLILSRNPQKLFIVNENNVLTLKEKFPDSLVVGESFYLPNDFFDSRNLPYLINQLDLENKTILYMSNNGSRVIEDLIQKKVKKVITCSFNNLLSVFEWLKKQEIGEIDLVASGEKGFNDKKSWEDWYAGLSLKNLLEGKNFIENYTQKAKDFVKNNYYKRSRLSEPEIFQNFPLVFTLNKYPLVPICQENEGYLSVNTDKK